MKRRGKRGAARARRNPPAATKRAGPRSPKAIEIVGLVEALSADLGVGNGLYLGSGIARLLAETYEQRRGAIPPWVQQLVAHYAGRSHEG
ncbi:MAG TPA: hypothetical protein VM736_15105 [Gemmatimonadales bacterium]|nr:hypothetical protein [Gemmatimonadales bacterium]